MTLKYIFLSFLIGSQLLYAAEISYKISWDNPNSHYYNVSIRASVTSGSETSFRIPAWRPGRYRIQNYSRNIIQFHARTPDGKQLEVRKTDKDTWAVTHGRIDQLVVEYRYYARELDAGASYLDAHEAYINPVTVLMYLPGREQQAVELQVKQPDGWQIDAALDRKSRRGGFTASSYHELADSPIIVSPDLDLLEYDQDGATIAFAIQSYGNYDGAQLLEDVEKITREQAAIFGGLPFKRYLFLYHFINQRMSHGVEHKNSTSIVSGAVDFSDPNYYDRLMGVTAHEFFHVWNVERIRPESIYYPDYSEESYTRDMWFYEGVTSYYDDLTRTRCGLLTEEEFLDRAGRQASRHIRNRGSRITSLELASWNSWNKTASAPPKTGVSFYSAGQLMGMLLDLLIRKETNGNKSLDDVFRHLYVNYAARNKGVPEDGIQQAAETVAGTSLNPFFEKHVAGTDSIDYNAFFEWIGMELAPAHAPWLPEAVLGISARNQDGGLLVRQVDEGSPAFDAGLVIDDLIVAVNRTQVGTTSLEAILQQYAPGAVVDIHYFHQTQLHKISVKLSAGGNTVYSLRPLENVTNAQITARTDWLSSQQSD